MDIRPIAIVCYPKYDHNGAFRTASWAPLKEKYDVRYYEVGSDEELKAALEDGSKDGIVDVVWIGAHGAPDKMQLGNGYGDERDMFDLGDEAKFKDALKYIRPGASIVLDSCMTGQGRDKINNVANMIKRLSPMSEVYASEVSTTSGTLAKLNENGKFVDPGFVAWGPEKNFVYHQAATIPTPDTAAWYAAIVTCNLLASRVWKR